MPDRHHLRSADELVLKRIDQLSLISSAPPRSVPLCASNSVSSSRLRGPVHALIVESVDRPAENESTACDILLFAHSLDPATRTYRVLPAEFAWIFNVEWLFSIPAGATAAGVPHFSAFRTADVHAPDGAMPESLGSARIAGVDAIGWRVTHAWPVMCRDCGGPGAQPEERWESPDLRVVVFARHLDDGDAVARIYPGKGVEIGYRLTNIVRAEPPAVLFDLPASYVRRTSGPSDSVMVFVGP